MMLSNSQFLLLPCLLLGYYVLVRLWLRRDIATDAVVVQYEPPDGLSPADLRLVDCGCTDAISIAAMIAQLGIKGALSAVRRPDGSFLLVRRLPIKDPALSDEECAVFRKIFDPNLGTEAGADAELPTKLDLGDEPTPMAPPLRSTLLTSSLGEASTTRMSATTAALHELAAKAIANRYYRWNFAYVFAGMLFTLGFGLWNAANIESREPLLFLTVWYFFFAQMITAMLAMNASRTKRWPQPLTIVVTILLWAVVLVLPILIAKKLATSEAMEMTGAFAAMIIVNGAFVPLLRTPTAAGVALKQKIAGYRQFLESVEADRLDRIADHGLNPLTNEHLAYAIALGIDESWGEALELTTMTAATSV